MIRLKTILHPTDFSEESRYALEVACGLARDQAARVVLLHVLPRPSPIGRDSQVPAFKDAHTDEDLQTYRQEMMNRLERLRIEAPNADVRPVLREGDVAGVIIRTAEETPCDLIVMGCHSAADVTRGAPCPVVTVRLPAAASSISARAGMEAAAKIC